MQSSIYGLWCERKTMRSVAPREDWFFRFHFGRGIYFVWRRVGDTHHSTQTTAVCIVVVQFRNVCQAKEPNLSYFMWILNSVFCSSFRRDMLMLNAQLVAWIRCQENRGTWKVSFLLSGYRVPLVIQPIYPDPFENFAYRHIAIVCLEVSISRERPRHRNLLICWQCVTIFSGTYQSLSRWRGKQQTMFAKKTRKINHCLCCENSTWSHFIQKHLKIRAQHHILSTLLLHHRRWVNLMGHSPPKSFQV